MDLNNIMKQIDILISEYENNLLSIHLLEEKSKEVVLEKVKPFDIQLYYNKEPKVVTFLYSQKYKREILAIKTLNNKWFFIDINKSNFIQEIYPTTYVIELSKIDAKQLTADEYLLEKQLLIERWSIDTRSIYSYIHANIMNWFVY